MFNRVHHPSGISVAGLWPRDTLYAPGLRKYIFSVFLRLPKLALVGPSHVKTKLHLKESPKN